ncbi:MAG: cobyrinate a,c-diamide synthase [Syntrophobacteraceae bacterium]
MSRKHAFMIAGTQSGCGKTTISLALMSAFKARGLRIQPFKVGPDFIDPGFHTRVTGFESRNLDGWMLSYDYNRALFGRLLSEADMAIVEGVMGLYDGYDGTGEAGSSAEMAKWLGLPVVLIVDARSMARSAAALVCGFSRFDPKLNLAGVIFNRTGGEVHLQYLKEAMSAALPDIAVLGGIPYEDSINIPERHLGLVTSDELQLTSEWQQVAGRMAERFIDLDLLLNRAEYGRKDLFEVAENPENKAHHPTIIAIARDAAFCFYYPDNFEMLRKSGAELRFFSPLSGEGIPDGASGLYLGGGYPELFAENLSERTGFFDSLRRAALKGMPIYAECGGLMVLSRFIESVEGKRYRMGGILPFGTRMLSGLKALGYTEVEIRQPCLLGDPGIKLKGHEFHYSEIIEDEPPSSLQYAYYLRKRKLEAARLEGFSVGSVLAGYIHLHWGSAVEAPAAFVDHCSQYREQTKI